MKVSAAIFCLLSALLIHAACQSTEEDEFTIIVSKPDLTIVNPGPIIATLTPNPQLGFENIVPAAAAPVIPATVRTPSCGSMNGFPCSRLLLLGCVCPIPTQMYWRASYDMCLSNGKNLINIETQELQEEIISEFPKLIKPGSIFESIGFWTSGTLIQNTKTFRWASISRYFDYTNWMDQEPSGINNPNDCVRAIPTANYQWGDADCYQLLPFVCHSP